MYTTADGEVFASKEEYYNSAGLESSLIAIYLQAGKRMPQNEEEEKMLKQIQHLQKDGKAIDIPYGTY